MKTGLLAFICLGFLVACCSSKAMWGSRKKKEQKEIEVKKPKMQQPSKRRQAMQHHKPSVFDQITPSEQEKEGITELFDAYVKIVDDLLDSGEFETMVNPSTITAMLSQIPGIVDNPELSDIFNSPEFTDPKLLKQSIRDGIDMVRMYSSEIIDTLKDPTKFAAALEQLPPEVADIFNGLKSGDTSVLENFITNLPGVDENQKNMLQNLLRGNTAGLTDQIQKVLGSPDQMETARLQFLESPELALAMGLSMDVLEDPVQFARLMTQGIDELSRLDEIEITDQGTTTSHSSSGSGGGSTRHSTSKGGISNTATGGKRQSVEETELQRLKQKFMSDFNRAA